MGIYLQNANRNSLFCSSAGQWLSYFSHPPRAPLCLCSSRVNPKRKWERLWLYLSTFFSLTAHTYLKLKSVTATATQLTATSAARCTERCVGVDTHPCPCGPVGLLLTAHTHTEPCRLVGWRDLILLVVRRGVDASMRPPLQVRLAYI